MPILLGPNNLDWLSWQKIGECLKPPQKEKVNLVSLAKWAKGNWIGKVPGGGSHIFHNLGGKLDSLNSYLAAGSFNRPVLGAGQWVTNANSRKHE